MNNYKLWKCVHRMKVYKIIKYIKLNGLSSFIIISIKTFVVAVMCFLLGNTHYTSIKCRTMSNRELGKNSQNETKIHITNSKAL